MTKTTNSRHRPGYSPNLLIDAPSPTRVNQVWLGDITYVPLEGGVFCYLALHLDLYSRRIDGWSLKNDMTEYLVLACLRMTIRERQPAAGLIHHTDRGGQYVGNSYRAVMRRSQIRDSMSRADNCYDNAFMESGIGTIRNELEMTEYKTMHDALKEISPYVPNDNFEHRHSAIEYLTPAKFEQLQRRSKQENGWSLEPAAPHSLCGCFSEQRAGAQRSVHACIFGIPVAAL